MQTVSLRKCTEYTNKTLKNTIIESLEAINFDMHQFKSARVALKPNLLMLAKAKQGVTTDPEFFRAVAQIVKQYGGTPILIESPAMQSLDRIIKKTQYKEIVASEGIIVADPGPKKALKYNNAKSFKHIEIQSAFFNTDIILNLPKFKTHGLTYMTGAVKNLFGAIPGLHKSKMHVKQPNKVDFSDFLLDLYGAMKFGFEPQKPLIHIMDAIIVQEGEGPGPGGTPKKMDAIIVGEDAIAVDYVAVKVAGLDVSKSLTVTQGFDRKYGARSQEDITVVGETISEMQLDDFTPSKETIMSNMVRWPVTSKTFKNLFIDRPVPNQERCTQCLQCKKICSSNAINKSSKNGGNPEYDYKKCIRCYCCMEICPEAAIEKEQGKLQWMLRM